MKLNWLVIIIFFVILSAFNIKSTFEFSNSSVRILSEEVNVSKKGDVIVFSLSLSSANNLQSFSVTPDIVGLNPDSELKYTFNNSTKQATVNYFYAIPENLDKNQEITFKFTLQDSKKTYISEKNVKLK